MSDATHPAPRRRWWRRAIIGLVVFLLLVAIADEIARRGSPRPAPGQAQVQTTEIQRGLLTVEDLPAGFVPADQGGHLIVNARKATEYPDAAGMLDRFEQLGRLTGTRVRFERPATAGAPRGIVTAETAVFRDATGARTFWEEEQARISAGAERAPIAGPPAVAGWWVSRSPVFSALRVLFLQGRQVGEITLVGPADIANPQVAADLAGRIIDRIEG